MWNNSLLAYFFHDSVFHCLSAVSLPCVSLRVSLSSSYLESIKLLGHLQLQLSANLGRFQPFFFPPSILFFLSYTPVWDFHNAYVGPLVGVLQVFKLCLLFFTRFVCCFSDLIIFTILFSSLLILFSVHPNLTLNPPSGFFFFYISHFTFSSKFLFAPLWFLPLYWYFSQFHFISYIIFLTFSVLSFSCSDVFKIVI